MRPAMRLPLNTRAGNVFMLVPPPCRCTFFTPCVARWPLKLCRRMTPAVPRPLLVPVTSTAATFSKTSTFSIWPTVIAFDRAAELADEPLRFAVGLGERLDAGFGPRLGPLAVELATWPRWLRLARRRGLSRKPNLNRFVAVALHGAQLQHVAGTGLDHGHRNRVPASSKI